MGGVVIVGASAAGWSTAESLRRFGYDGSVTIVGAESIPAYDRPPLSKQLLTGEWDHDRAVLIPATRMDKVDARVMLGTRALHLAVAERHVELSSGERLAFDDIVIATGVRPRTLEVLPDAVVLRTLTDCIALRERLLSQPELVIVGAGFIGLEVAASARKMGARVTVVEPMADPLASRIGSAIADKLIALHRAAGVDLHLGVGVTAADTDTHGNRRVVLSDGTQVPGDLVLAAIGCAPVTEWLAGTELDTSDGVLCDEYGRAAPGVWAAGDVARWQHPGYGLPVRVEHRQNAAEQGSLVARSITGPLAPLATVPYFWTDQYDAKIQVAGRITPTSTPTIVEGSIDDESLVMLFEDAGRPSAVLGWNAAKAMLPYRRELAAAA